MCVRSSQLVEAIETSYQVVYSMRNGGGIQVSKESETPPADLPEPDERDEEDEEKDETGGGEG